MQHCVVLGGNGFIGRYLCKELEQHGYNVTALVRAVVTDAWSAKTQIAADLHDAKETAEHFLNADYVVCLAPSSLPATANENISSEIRTHVEATIRLAEYAATSGVKKFLFASSGGTVYGENESELLTEDSPTNPIGAYGASKLSIEQYLGVLQRHSNMSTVSLRIANPYGIGQNIHKGQGFISALLACYLNQNPVSIWGDGEVYRDFLNVTDVATAMRCSLEYTGTESTFNIGSSYGYSLNQVISIFEELTGKFFDLKYMPGRAFDVRSNVLDNSLAKSELNWEPTISLKNGIDSLVKHHDSLHSVAA